MESEEFVVNADVCQGLVISLHLLIIVHEALLKNFRTGLSWNCCIQIIWF